MEEEPNGIKGIGLYEFMMLSEIQQYAMIAFRADFVTSINGMGSSYHLYALGTMFIELEREFFTEKIIGKSIFKRGAKLEKYLGISGVLN